MASDERDINFNITATAETGAATDKAAHDFDKVQRAADDLNMTKASKSVKDFDRQVTQSIGNSEKTFKNIETEIENARKRIVTLQKQVKTGAGTSVFGDLKKAQSDLKGLERIFTSLGGDAEKAGQNFVQVFGSQLSESLPAIASPQGAAIAAAIVAAATPIIGAGIAAAISGGVGLGLVAAAVVIQKDNPVIKSALSSLGADAKSTFQDATSGLVEPLAAGINELQGFVDHEGPRFRAIFDPLGPAVHIIVNDFDTLAGDILPGLAKVTGGFTTAIENPAVNKSINQLGKSFNALFEEIGNNPQLITDAFVVFNTVVGGTVDILNGLVHIAVTADKLFHDAFGSDNTKSALGYSHAVDQVGDSAQRTIQPMDQLSDKQKAGAVAVKNLGDNTAKAGVDAQKTIPNFAQLAQQHGKTGAAAAAAAAQTDQLTDAQRASATMAGIAERAQAGVRVTYQQLSTEISQTTLTSSRLQGELADNMFATLNSLDTATLNWHESLTSLGDTIDQLTPKQRKAAGTLDLNNKSAQALDQSLLSVISSNQQTYDSMIEAGIGADDATKAYDSNTKALEAQLKKQGLLTPAVQKLIDKYGQVPDQVSTSVAIEGLTDAISDLNTTLQYLEDIPGTYTANVRINVNREALNEARNIARATGSAAPFAGDPLAYWMPALPHAHGGGGTTEAPRQVTATVDNFVSVNLDGQPFRAMIVHSRSRDRHRQRVGVRR
jgi:hypothetical protein